MILHCVWVRFKDQIKPEQKLSIFGEISALQDKIPGIVDVKSGRNVSPEGLHAGFEDGFVVTFTSEDARDAYLVHPDHQIAGSKIVEAAEGGLSGILVFDLAI